jgi:hypothetical protein
MKLQNLSAFSATLLRNASARSDEHMIACVIARGLFRVAPDGTLAEAPEPWAVDPSPIETPLGRTPGDKPFYLGGIDVLIGGRVFAPERRPTSRLEVQVEVGRHFRRRLAVFGDRRWKRGAEGRLEIGPPELFLSMPLTYARAFGGRARTPHGELPYPANAEGRGYHHDDLAALGQLLPNLEQPAQLIEQPSDRPVPVGLGYYGATGALRPLAAIDHPAVAGARGVLFGKRIEGAPAAEPPSADATIGPENLRPILFNQAHPDMIIEARTGPLPGDRVRLSAGRRDGSDLAFSLPPPLLHLHVQLEDRHHLLPLHLDQIGLLGGEERVMLGYRVVFEYPTRRGEQRFATLHPGDRPAEIPPGYDRRVAAVWDPFDEAVALSS